MSDLKAKMHQNRFLPQTLLGELTVLPRPLAAFKGPTSKGRVEVGTGGERGKGPRVYL